MRADAVGRHVRWANLSISAVFRHCDACFLGVIIVAVGGYHVYEGASRPNFRDDLKGNSIDLVRRLGTVGYIAKGLVIAGARVPVVVAASRSEPNKATGLDGALKHSGPNPTEQRS